MAGVPVRFRCYRCNQLLGVSQSKIGKTVSCPKCAVKLIVPEPVQDEADQPAALSSGESVAAIARPARPFLDAGSPSASGITAVELLSELRPEDLRVEPGVLWEPPPPAPPEAPAAVTPEEPFVEPLEVAETRPEPESEPVALPALPVEPVPVAITAVAPAPSARLRSRDVVLPRSVVLAWSLFVLLALASAFGAGLLAGHFIWRVH